MSISSQSLNFITHALTSPTAGQEFVDAVQNSSTLSADTANRLRHALGEDSVALNVQAAILGTHVLTDRDLSFMKSAFASEAVSLEVAANMAVGSVSFSPEAGSFGPAQSVSLYSITPGAVIHYTTNGSTPTSASATYSSPIAVAATTTIKAIAITTGVHNSPVTSSLFTINGAVATPTFAPTAGSYVGAQSVTVSSVTAGATFYYTINGTTPTTASTLYTGPIAVAADLTIKVLGVKTNYSNSAIATAAYTIT